MRVKVKDLRLGWRKCALIFGNCALIFGNCALIFGNCALVGEVAPKIEGIVLMLIFIQLLPKKLN
ncbi:hypothetical protein DZB84_10005 [Bacillus sp. HNG]|nr:hypothetical protein DZB84_10005 [Bacillus sp. HNG]